MAEDFHGIRTLAIDIGGSGLKMLVLDETGTPVTERSRKPTPQKGTPENVLAVLKKQIAGQGAFDRVSVGFPGVVIDGVAHKAVNLDPGWDGFDIAKALADITGKPVRVANDADVQGLGVIEGKGVELVITLGTGIGTALYVHGHSVPNLEFGHHPFSKDRTYEVCLGNAALKKAGDAKWNRRLKNAIRIWDRVFNYRMLYLGGGNARKISFKLPANARKVPNIAGLLGGIALWRD
ncbi:MAG TPA: ROK family protein [Bryobacterales bacterium]|nr:ROK family protein [Bryobacterales bacterium]